jgi:hypothetical protein
MRGICKNLRQIIDDFYPDEVMHLILAKNNPQQLETLFDSKPKMKLAFEQCLADSVPTPLVRSEHAIPTTKPKNTRRGWSESDEDDFDLGAWHGSLQQCLERALQHCQAQLLPGLLRAGVVRQEDIELHIVCTIGDDEGYDSDGTPESGIDMFLALRARTHDNPRLGVHSLDPRPLGPHARWTFARVLAALCGRVWDLPPQASGGRGMAVQARDPAAGPTWKVVISE